MRGTGAVIIIAFLIATAIFFMSTQEGKLSPSPAGQLPDPGITPRNPFYFVDIITENFLLFLYSKPNLKAPAAFRLAKEKLAEVKLLEEHFEQASYASEQINKRAAEKSQELYNKYLDLAYKNALLSTPTSIEKTDITYSFESLDLLLSKGSAQPESPTQAIINAVGDRIKNKMSEIKIATLSFFKEQIQKIKSVAASFLKRKTNEAIDDLFNATSS